MRDRLVIPLIRALWEEREFPRDAALRFTEERLHGGATMSKLR